MLVVVSAPRGLQQNQVLNTAKEEDLILEATRAARQAGKLAIEFSPNGSLETLQAYLQEYDPHMLHFVGHGVFDEVADAGYLLVEAQDGSQAMVSNQDFAKMLAQQGIRCAWYSCLPANPQSPPRPAALPI